MTDLINAWFGASRAQWSVIATLIVLLLLVALLGRWTRRRRARSRNPPGDATR